MRYIRLMLGRKSIHADRCFAEGFVGGNFDITEDLSGKLPDNWRDFNKEFIPIYLEKHPEKSKIAAGLACGMLWTVAKGIKNGDNLLCPDGTGKYHLGEITGDYYYEPGEILPHRRKVKWSGIYIDRSDMSESLRNSTGSTGTTCDISSYADEIEILIGRKPVSGIQSHDPEIEDPYAFAMEKHLEDFLAMNWSQTELGREYDLFEEDGELVGQQYLTDTGAIDLLAISKDKKTLLVVELKKGRASDAVVGQILRYMGFVKEVLAEEDQVVKGIIIALDDDLRLRRAIAMVPNTEFYRYQVSFKLVKG